MGFAQIATVLTVALSGLLPSSCTKAHPSATKATSTNSAVTASTNVKDLGELSLTDRHETCIQLGAGKSCTITPKVLDKHSIELTMAVETKKANGRTDDLSITEVIATQGKPFEIAVGNMNLSLTPNILSP